MPKRYEVVTTKAKTYTVSVRWNQQSETSHDFTDYDTAMHVIGEHLRMNSFSHVNIEMGDQG